MTLPVAILAGGLATRLRPITKKIPKSLVEVAGEPFIVRQLDYLHQQKVRDVVLCVGHLGDMIKAVVGDGSHFGLKVSYSIDGPVLLGTGGALRRASGLLGEASFVLYGDSYLPVDFSNIEAEFWASNQPALMTVLYNQDRWDKSNVLFVDGKLLEYNKAAPRADFAYIDSGLTIVKREVLESYQANEPFDLAALYHRLSLEGRLHGYQVFDRFYEIGSPNGLKEAHDFFSDGKQDMTYAQQHIAETIAIANKIDATAIEKMADLLAQVKADGGRVFFLGVGGSAGNSSHAVNDFRKIVGIESYAPTDNVSELTARTNDEGWATIFVEWLKVSKLQPKDALFIFSVGGGNLDKNISPNLVEAIKYAKIVRAKVTGVVGRDGGYTAQAADACCIVPTVNPHTITPHSEAFQAVVWHLLVSHPKLKAYQTKWESTVRK
jgi:D-sedoheptulose 7-phosphate isomerase